MPMRVVRFARKAARLHWQAIAISVLVLATAAVGSYAIISNGQQNDEDARRAVAINAQFCTAIPNVAARTAQALVDILVTDATAHHVPRARIDNTRRLGRLYVSRARLLALSDLPACTQIKEAP